jgi:PAS domain S-box-containing protein
MNALESDKVPSNEKLCSALVNSLRGIVWEADPSTFQFSFVSSRAENILGYPVQQWIDEPDFWRAHTHPDDVEWCTAFCHDAAAKRKDHDFQYRMIAADGRVVWLHDIVTVVRLDDGTMRLRGIMIDVTERKTDEEELRLKSFTIDNLAEEIIWITQDGRIWHVNDVACERLGYVNRHAIMTHFGG